MARKSAVIQAAKSVPGGARPTPAPQSGSTPYYGGMSPLAMQLANERGYANTYGPFLPRPTEAFTEGAFGPFSPILPVPVDAPDVEGGLPDPRRFQYETGWNLPVGQPGTEGLGKMVDFGTLQTLADLYSVARTCIQTRKAEIRGLDWDIIPTHEAAKAYQGDHGAMRDFGERRAEAVKFFKHPDPDYFSFGSWLDALLEEVFVLDALSLNLRPVRAKGMGKGLLGSDLGSIELVHGATIRPLLDMHGATPRPPAPAYQQYLYGVPRSDLMTMITQRDIDEGGLTGSEVNIFASDQLLYLPFVPRRWTPYGFPPVERALIPIMSGLQKQGYQLDYYREGTVPAVYISPGDPNITPSQVRELQDALNAIAGDPAWHHKIIVLPPGSKVDPQRPVDLADQFDEIIMNQVCMAFDVQPMEIGIIPQVSTAVSPFAAREMAQASHAVHERKSTKPLLKFLCDIFDNVLHRVCGQDDMKFTFEGLQEEADQAAVTDLVVKQVQYGLRSVDEAREELHLPPWNLDETTGPVVFTQMGPVEFEVGAGIVQQQAQMAAQQGQQQNSNSNSSSSSSSGSKKPKKSGSDSDNSKKPVKPPKATSTTGRGDQYGGPGRPRHNTPLGGGAKTPGHASALGHMAAIGGSKPGSGGKSPSQNAGRGAKKVAELEAMARHVKKGRDILTWEPRHITGAELAMITEDLDKGLTVDQVIALAMPIVAKADDAAPKAPESYRLLKYWPGWQQDQEVADRYAHLLKAAFARAADKASVLVAQWWSGELPTTRQELVRAVGALVHDEVGPVLRELWTEGWGLGKHFGEIVGREAGHAVSHSSDDELRRLLEGTGADYLKGIANTRMDKLAAVLSVAVAQGLSATYVASQIHTVLLTDSRSDMIAMTELTRAQAAGALQRYKEMGVEKKEWAAAPGACVRCANNEAAGPIPLSAPFPSGDLGSPAHPRCRCAIVPAGYSGMLTDHTGKSSRYVDLNGQVYLAAENEAAFVAAGGGLPGVRPHDEDGVQHPEASEPSAHSLVKGHSESTVLPGLSVPSGSTAHSFEKGHSSNTVPADGTGRSQSQVLAIETARTDLTVHKIATAHSASPELSRRTDLSAATAHLGLSDLSLKTVHADRADHSDPSAQSRHADGYDLIPFGVPGASQSMDRIPWDGGDPEPHVLTAPDDEDDADFPVDRGRAPNPMGKYDDVSTGDEDPHRVAFVLIRARNDEGKWRYLLQLRAEDTNNGGTWGLPGGGLHIGEEPWTGAQRETAEEMGTLPLSDPKMTFVREQGSKTVYTFLVEIPEQFRPTADGETSQEIGGWGWFSRKDVAELPLHPAFRRTWDSLEWNTVGKSADTPRLSSEHNPLGTHGLWGRKEDQLPAYMQNIAHALMRDHGMEESQAIATAHNAVERWANGNLGEGEHHVSPEVQQASREALQEWETLRASHQHGAAE